MAASVTDKSGGTEVRYTGEAQVGGLIASVGQRMIEAAAKKIIQQFFESASTELKKNP
jgi:carbon monoxide dehydrogenase subunit G